MRSITIWLSSLALITVPVTLQSQHATHADHAAHGGHATNDSAFAAMQSRGRDAMGVDQYTSIHRFDALPDGGRIELQRDRDDSVGTLAIRAHMRAIALAFSTGDFSTPAVVHMKSIPGASTMRVLRRAIRYEPSDLPRGGALRIRSNDGAAIAAVHRFLAFQRTEHRVSPANRQ